MLVLKNNFRLIYSLTKRDIENRYKNSTLGLAWTIVFPLFMLLIYSFVFGFVFKAKWGGELKANYSLIMFIGLIVHSFLADCIGRATSLIQGNANYVKKVVFPLESLCWVALLSALFQFVIGLSVFFLFYFIDGNGISLTILLLPFVILPFVILAYSLILFLSSLSVYIRDVAHIMSIVISVMLFMSPVFYSIDAVPANYQWVLYLNPITYIIETLRGCIIYGKGIEPLGYTIYLAISVVLYVVANKWFNMTKRGFSDVL
ncbi:ABC transporter permease [Photobacterium sp. OFAV2-7]|uniref:ABC transporter permease n=1 Tax=Photobacterium sp. OFAV2-7 TaxID=2917748 RepID=UPI001EF62719|nr:ABC transporter permease [Photobacterium sp. OFAV2-7]MCG7586641.1 ABC transporter permease [Photobacterium sp. OFAV2-7]